MHRIFKVMNILIKFIYWLLSILNEDGDYKLIKSFNLNGIKVLSDEGWSDTTHIHMTKPFYIYKLELDNGMKLDCADDHIVFCERNIEKFVKDLTYDDIILTKNGPSKIKSITKTNIDINMCDLTVDNKKHSYYTNGILSHNTVTSSLFMLHYICFNTDKNALVLGNKRKTAVEVLSKAKSIYFELPYFLKPGIYKWNESEIVLDNGCRLMAEATTINSGISFTFHCVLADEFAHIAPNIVEKFYTNLFPTITAARARFMITSTQNGYNLFYRLWKAAQAGENEYKPFEVTWDRIPEWNPDKRCWEKRDEVWRQLQIANYGSEEAFNSQFGTDFDVSANTLINKRKLDVKKREVVEFIEKDLYGVPHFQYYNWDPSYTPMEDLKKDHIVITCDLAEGGGGDYTVFSFYKMIEDGKLKCIGYFRSNSLLREDCSLSLQTLICKYMNMDKVLLSYEKNTYGDLFYRDLIDNSEKINYISSVFDQSILIKYYNDSGSKFTYGIKLTSGNKSNHCLLFKESYERNNIINNDTKFMSELLSFTNDGTGHYKASFGHDDLVMSTIQLEFVKNTLQYKIMRDSYESLKDIVQNDNDMYNPFENFNNEYDLYSNRLGGVFWKL